MTKEEHELSIEYLEGIKDNYIKGYGYERHPLPEYYAIENAIKALEQQDRIKQILDDYDLEAWEILEKIKEVVRV
jgi:hypothetical protein